MVVERERRNNDADLNAPIIGTRHIQVLLDRSGSMASILPQTVEGYGAFLAEQRAIPGAEIVRYVLSQFDDQGVQDIDVGTIASAKPLALVPRGGTPLLDAVGKTVEAAAKRMQPEDVMLFVIITDGQENSSREWTLEKVRALIAEKMDAGWVFVYLGANQDAWSEAAQMGIPVANAYNYSGQTTADAYGATSTMSTSFRSSPTRAKMVNDTSFAAQGIKDDKQKAEAKWKAEQDKQNRP